MMETALTVLASLLLLAGLFLCGVNAAIALGNLRPAADRHVSMVPLVPSLFLIAAVMLLRLAGSPVAVPLLPLLLLDLSGLPSMLLLPFYLLRRALRDADAPPLLPPGGARVLIVLYLAAMVLLALACALIYPHTPSLNSILASSQHSISRVTHFLLAIWEQTC